MNKKIAKQLAEKSKQVPGRRTFTDVNVLDSSETGASTYIVLTGLVVVPTKLKNALTKRELFCFLQSRGLVAANAVFVSSHFPVSANE